MIGKKFVMCKILRSGGKYFTACSVNCMQPLKCSDLKFRGNKRTPSSVISYYQSATIYNLPLQ